MLATPVSEKNERDKGNKDEVLGCQFGNQKVMVPAGPLSPEKKRQIALKIQNALNQEVSEKYHISIEPEYTQKWNDSLAAFSSFGNKDISKAPASAKKILEKKKADLRAAILDMKVSKYIDADLMKTDKEYSAFFSQDPAVLSANKSVIDKILENETALNFKNRKINGWWIRFISKQNFDFGERGCEEIVGRMKKEGPRKWK